MRSSTRPIGRRRLPRAGSWPPSSRARPPARRRPRRARARRGRRPRRRPRRSRSSVRSPRAHIGRAKREHELLARRAQPAGRSVETREHDLLDASVTPSGSRHSRGAHGSATGVGSYDAPRGPRRDDEQDRDARARRPGVASPHRILQAIATETAQRGRRDHRGETSRKEVVPSRRDVAGRRERGLELRYAGWSRPWNAGLTSGMRPRLDRLRRGRPGRPSCRADGMSVEDGRRPAANASSRTRSSAEVKRGVKERPRTTPACRKAIVQPPSQPGRFVRPRPLGERGQR